MDSSEAEKEAMTEETKAETEDTRMTDNQGSMAQEKD